MVVQCALQEGDAGTVAILLVQDSCQILELDGWRWLIQIATLYAVFPLQFLVLLIVGLDRWRMPLVICRMTLFGTYKSHLSHYRRLNIPHRLAWDSGIRQFGERHMVKTLALVNIICGLSQLVCFVWETGFWCTCTICLAGVIEDVFE